MFCMNCGKIIKEGSRYCQYCGQSADSQISTSSGAEYSLAMQQRTDVRKKLTVCVCAVAIILGLFYVVGNYHKCDSCGKTYIGAAYYDAWDSKDIMCEKCARKYYQGFNYQQYKVR